MWVILLLLLLLLLLLSQFQVWLIDQAWYQEGHLALEIQSLQCWSSYSGPQASSAPYCDRYWKSCTEITAVYEHAYFSCEGMVFL